MELNVSKEINIKLTLECNLAQDIVECPETEKFYNIIHNCPDNSQTLKSFIYDNENDVFYCSDCSINFPREAILDILNALSDYFNEEIT